MPRAFAWYVFSRTLFFFKPPSLLNSLHSAEAVSGIIFADMTQRKWTPPEWFPVHYLTTKDVL